jgi:hypothetical protein
MESERDAILARLTLFPGRLAEAARAVAAADDAAGGPPAGEWSARENVGDLIAVERAVWHARLDGLAVLPAGEEPAWTWFEPGPVEDPDAATLESALALFARERSATLARLDALDEAGWSRTGIHATYGRLDVAGLLGIAADHDDEHIRTMTAGRTGLARQDRGGRT